MGAYFWPREEGLYKDPFDHRPKKAQRVPQRPTTPSTNMEASGGIDPGPTVDVGDHVGSQGLLSSHGTTSGNQTMDEDLVQQPRMGAPGHAIRMVIEPILGTPVGQTHQGATLSMGNPTCVVGGRHNDLGIELEANNGPGHPSHSPPDHLGNTNQHREINGPTSQNLHISWTCVESEDEQDRPNARKARESQEVMQASHERKQVHPKDHGIVGGTIGGHGEEQCGAMGHTSTTHEHGGERSEAQQAQVASSIVGEDMVHRPTQIPLPENATTSPTSPKCPPKPMPPTIPLQQFLQIRSPNGCLGPRMGGLPQDGREGSGGMCSTMDPNAKEVAHHTQGGIGIGTSDGMAQGSYGGGISCGGAIGCNEHGDGMEQGKQESHDESAHHPTIDQNEPEEHPCDSHTHTRDHQYQSRLPEPPTRRQKLSPPTDDLPTNVQDIQLLPQLGPICQPQQPPNSQLLLVEGGPQEQRECIPTGLVPKPTIGSTHRGM